MGEYLIIDGYNVINAWKDFAQLRQENLEHARELLVAGVAEYAAFKGYRAVVVFDALEVAGAAVATVTGQIVAAVAAIILNQKKTEILP